MSMKTLMEGWRKFVILENANSIARLPEDVGVLINTEETPDEIGFSFVSLSDGSPSNEPYGELRISNMASQNSDYCGGCMDAYVVSYSKVDNGWAPLLYDVAIEWASLRGSGAGLAPDRAMTSEEAYQAWEQYMEDRPDVEVNQMDDLSNSLTPDESDNCAQNSAVSSAAHNGVEWHQSPLSKVYKKSDGATMKALQAAGKLVFREENQ